MSSHHNLIIGCIVLTAVSGMLYAVSNKKIYKPIDRHGYKFYGNSAVTEYWDTDKPHRLSNNYRTRKYDANEGLITKDRKYDSPRTRHAKTKYPSGQVKDIRDLFGGKK